MRNFSTTAFILVALVSVSCFKTAKSQTNNIGTLNNDPQFTKLVELINRANIGTNQAQTLFAPTNDAWTAFRDEETSLFTKYTTQAEFIVHLRELLQWHMVIEGSFTTDEIFDGGRGLLENLLGNITVDQRLKKVDNVALTSFSGANITTSQGYVHALDEVIIPPYMAVNLIEHMLERDTSDTFAYSTMANLALYVELDTFIDDIYENGITFMVPPNRRFNRAQINVENLLKEESMEYTKDFVLCHILKDNYHEAGIFAFNEENQQEQFMVKSELGTSFWITTTAGRLRFQSAEVLLTDRVARNGIFHVLDYPLFPPFISDFTELTAFSTTWDTSDCFRFFRQALLSSEQISRMFNTSLTMFCPSREAFEVFNNEDFNRLLEPKWERHATEFLLNHITAGARTREELVAEAPGFITMLNGATYELRRSGDRPRIKNTKFEQGRSEYGDIVALDGYLHMLDSAITPTAVSRSIYDQSQDNPDFFILVENIKLVDLQDMIDRDSPLTLLAPDNTAFRRVSFSSIGGGEIIKRHLFEGLNFCDVIANETELESLAGDIWDVELRGEPGSGEWGLSGGQNLFIGDAYVYNCDIFARNGVLHHIDRVLGLPYDTVAPTDSPAPTVTASPTEFIPPTPAPVPTTGNNFVPINLPPVVDTRPTVPTRAPTSTQSNSAGKSSIPSVVSSFVMLCVATTLLHW